MRAAPLGEGSTRYVGEAAAAAVATIEARPRTAQQSPPRMDGRAVFTSVVSRHTPNEASTTPTLAMSTESKDTSPALKDSSKYMQDSSAPHCS